MTYVCRAEHSELDEQNKSCALFGLKQCHYCAWYQAGNGKKHYPVPALYAKTVWFPEGNPFVTCPGIPYVNLLAYNGVSDGTRHGYYTLKRYYIFWDSVVDYLTY